MNIDNVTNIQDAPSKRTQANRRNALKSTGPRTKAGKQRVSMNAFKHGLSGQNLCLQADESVPYFRLALDYIEDLRPVGAREEQMAQKIIDGNWRLNRAAAIENNLLNQDTVAEAKRISSDDDCTVAMTAQAEAWRADCEGPRALEALGRHEGRIARTLFKTTSEFDALQARRLKREDKDTFIAQESRAWQFFKSALDYFQAEEAKAQPAPAPEEPAEEITPEPSEEPDKTPQPTPNTTTSKVALICDWEDSEEPFAPMPASHYEDLRAFADRIGILLPRFNE